MKSLLHKILLPMVLIVQTILGFVWIYNNFIYEVKIKFWSGMFAIWGMSFIFFAVIGIFLFLENRSLKQKIKQYTIILIFAPVLFIGLLGFIGVCEDYNIPLEAVLSIYILYFLYLYRKFFIEFLYLLKTEIFQLKSTSKTLNRNVAGDKFHLQKKR